MYGDLIFSLSTVLLSLFFFIVNLINPTRKTTIVGPDFWPNLLLIALFVLGIVEFIISFKKLKKNRVEENKSGLSKEDKRKFISVVISIATYIFLLPYIGFLICSILIFIYLVILLGFKNKKIAVLIGIIFTIFLSLLFSKGLNISLPRGVGIFEFINTLAM